MSTKTSRMLITVKGRTSQSRHCLLVTRPSSEKRRNRHVPDPGLTRTKHLAPRPRPHTKDADGKPRPGLITPDQG